jgi:hypothetical protein
MTPETNIINEVLIVAIQALGALALALVTYYGKRLLQKAEGKVSAETLAEAERYLSMGASYAVNYAEEKARAWVLEKTEKVTPAQKLDWAAQWFRDNYREQVAGWTEEQLLNYVLAKLGAKREHAVGGPFGDPPAPAKVGDGLMDPTELR